MVYHVNDDKPSDASAAERDEASRARREQAGRTGAGQEAARGKAPEEHDREHKSNYGGGGVHGGSDQAK